VGSSPTGESTAGLSGGGFSDYFGRPAWQDDPVAEYLKNSGLPHKSQYNASGAGFPDISAQVILYSLSTHLLVLKLPFLCQALRFEVVVAGATTPVDGTSCATPTSAGVFAMLNQDRISAGKSPLGFLNPLICKSSSIFPATAFLYF